MEFPSKEELHSIQKFVPLITKLRASGVNIQKILNQDPWKKGKRHCQNGLR
jgi:ribosomal protein L31E